MKDKDSFVINRTVTRISRSKDGSCEREEVPIHDEMDANKGLVIAVTYKDGKEEKIPCGRVLKSRKKVKTIPENGFLWCDIKERKKLGLCGIILRGVKSFSFDIDKEENKRWTVVAPGSCWLNHPKESQQAEFMWIETFVDSTTYRIILRGERVDEDVVIYSFVIP